MLLTQYGIEATSIEQSSLGAGSSTYYILGDSEEYVLKFPATSEINHPYQEIELCEYLLDCGMKVSKFIPNTNGRYISKDETGQGFFKNMTPQRGLASYKRSLLIAKKLGDENVIEDLKYRIGQMNKFPRMEFDLSKLTCQGTHGDYMISQIICGENTINGVIDWTTACVHPVVWEVIRSYLYGAQSCRSGQIDIADFIRYVENYLSYATLNKYDIDMMANLFYYQISVCDYYGQYYGSTAQNRIIFLQQAQFSTKLMKWFEENSNLMTEELCNHFG